MADIPDIPRMTWWQISCGLGRWFWYQLKKDWQEYNRKLEAVREPLTWETLARGKRRRREARKA